MAKFIPLSKCLELAHEGRSVQKAYAEGIPKHLTMWEGDKIVRVRELLLSEQIESTSVIQTAYISTLIEGAEPVKCYRGLLNEYRGFKSNSLKVIIGESGTYAEEVAEGAPVPIDTQDYANVTYSPVKYGTRPLITTEIIEDGLFNIVESEVRKAGAKMENTLNQKVNNTLLEGSGLEWDTAETSGAQGVKAVAKAIAAVKGASFMPDIVVMHPDAEGYVALDIIAPNPANPGGNWIPPRYLGLQWYVCGVADVTGGSYTWGYDSNGDIGMMVMSSKDAGGVAYARDLKIENYRDPVSDLAGSVVTMRFDQKVHQADAICRVEF